MRVIEQAISEKRIGKIVISVELLNNILFSSSELLKRQGEVFCSKFLSKIFIVNAELNEGMITYLAYSPEFDIAEYIENPPQYNFIISKEIIEKPIYNFDLEIRKKQYKER